MRRSAAAVAAVGLFLLSGTLPAGAQPDLTILRSQDCHAFAPTDESDIPHAWHLERLDMTTAWTMATGRGVTVAVIDTGVASIGTPYFTPDRITTYDLQGGMSARDQQQGGIDCLHGTQVAGLLAGGQTQGRPVDVRTNFSGIAPEATILSYRVLVASADEQEDAPNDPVAATVAAINHAVDEGAQVINLSQTVSPSDPGIPALEHAVAEAINAGVVIVAAAGNEGESATGPAYPAAFDGVISVGMTMRGDAPSTDSRPVPETAPQITVGAPGSGVMSIIPSLARAEAAYTNQAYGTDIEGTSYATPLVAGVAALMLEKDPTLTPAEIKDRLVATADPPSNTAPAARLGFGIVNPVRALAGIGVPPDADPGSEDDIVVAQPLPEPEHRDMTPVYAGIGIGAGALFLTAVALVLSITIPAARRRTL